MPHYHKNTYTFYYNNNDLCNNLRHSQYYRYAHISKFDNIIDLFVYIPHNIDDKVSIEFQL